MRKYQALSIQHNGIKSRKISTTYDVVKGKDGFIECLEKIKIEAENLIKNKVSIIMHFLIEVLLKIKQLYLLY